MKWTVVLPLVVLVALAYSVSNGNTDYILLTSFSF